MSDGQRGKTDKLSTSTFRVSPVVNATEIYYHQRRADALAKYAPMVVPLLKELLENVFGSTPDYGVDDNIDVDSEVMRFGWRIFGKKAGETQFQDFTPQATQRKTLLAVELLFGEMGQPTGFLIDTRRTHTTTKTGLLGIKHKVTVTQGAARNVSLSETELAEALEEMAKTMER